MATIGETTREPTHGVPVASRIHWGPILGGVAVAFAVYFLLTLLGVAIGLSAREPGERLGTGTALWSVISVILALFIGGMVTTRCAVGEDRVEAMLYGAIVWGVTFVLFMWLMASGMGAGIDMFMNNQAMQQAGVHAAKAVGEAAAQVQQEVQQHPEKVQHVAAQAAWWAFIGVLLSIIAAIGGAVLGQNAGERRRHHHLGEPIGVRRV